MNEAFAMANTAQLNTLGCQMLNAKDFNRALKCFKLNIKNNPKSANTYDGLGEAYKTMGDKKNAVKSLKKALFLNPPKCKSEFRKAFKGIRNYVNTSSIKLQSVIKVQLLKLSFFC